MLEDFFNHRCDIYHIAETAVSPGYNLPASSDFSYPEKPDIAGAACHFGIKSQTVTVVQGEPAAVMESRIKLTLPIGTDIRLNDRIVNCDTGYEYTAEVPQKIQEHHIYVYIKRTERQKAL